MKWTNIGKIIFLACIILHFSSPAHASWMKAIQNLAEDIAARFRQKAPLPHSSQQPTSNTPSPGEGWAQHLPPPERGVGSSYLMPHGGIRILDKTVRKRLTSACEDLNRIPPGDEIGLESTTEIPVYSCAQDTCPPITIIPAGSYAVRFINVIETNQQCWVGIALAGQKQGYLKPDSAIISLLEKGDIWGGR